MKVLIVYSSKTGNTRKVAEALYAAAPVGSALRPVEEAGSPDGYDILFAGYWMDRGGADEKMKRFLRTLSGRRLVLFETMGADPASEHAWTGFANAATALAEGNTVLGVFAVQGAIDPALIRAMQARGEGDPHGGAAMQRQAALAASHPDEADLARASAYMKEFTAKYTRYFGK